MHINRNMSAVITNNQLLRTEKKLSTSMERLSSGLKINRASDNPAGVAISNKMKAQIDALDQAEANAIDATSVLQIADGALGEITSIIQRMRELSVQAANGVYSYDDRNSIQAEIDELQIEIDRISRDTEYNTKTLLDGSSDVRVYGEHGSRYYISDTVPAQKYMVNVEKAASQAEIEIAYEVPSVDGIISINGMAANIKADMTKDQYLQEIRTAAEQGGCSVSLSEDESKLWIHSNYDGNNEPLHVTMENALVEELGFTENEECEFLVSSSSMVFGPDVPKLEDQETGVLSIGGMEIKVTSDTTQKEFYDALSKVAIRNGYQASTNADGSLEIRNSSQEEANDIEFSFTNNLAEAMNIKNSYDGEYQVFSTGKDAVVPIPTNLEDSGFSSTTTVAIDGNRVVIADNNGFEIDFLLDSDYQAVADATNGNFEIEVTDIGPMTIQIGSNEHQTMEIRISEVSSSSLYLDTIDVAVTGGAERAMTALDEALEKLSVIRSKIGAFQNRLEYAVTSLSSTQENITAAYSGLTDTDMATEMAEYTQQNVLNQASISVLAQANEMPQKVLSLLR